MMVINTIQYKDLHENGVHAQFPAEKKAFDLLQENIRQYYYRLWDASMIGKTRGMCQVMCSPHFTAEGWEKTMQRSARILPSTL